MLSFTSFTWCDSTLSSYLHEYFKYCNFSQSPIQSLTHTFSTDGRGNRDILLQFLILLSTNSSILTLFFISFPVISMKTSCKAIHSTFNYSLLPTSSASSQSPPSLWVFFSYSINILCKRVLLNTSLITVGIIQFYLWNFWKGNLHSVSLLFIWLFKYN